jgi:hypothetical protein
MNQAQPGDPLSISAREWNEIRKLAPKGQGGSTGAGMKNPWFPEICYAKAPSGGIPARVGDVLGSAVCDLYERNNDDELVDTGRNETVYNISGTAVEGNAWIVITTEARRRDFVVIVESCEAES